MEGYWPRSSQGRETDTDWSDRAAEQTKSNTENRKIAWQQLSTKQREKEENKRKWRVCGARHSLNPAGVIHSVPTGSLPAAALTGVNPVITGSLLQHHEGGRG